MKRILLLLAILALTVSVYSCGGGGAASSNTPSGENPGIASVVQLSPSHNIAQTNASITLHAKVLDGNGAPLSGVPVTFTNLSEPFGVVSGALKLLGITKPIAILSATSVKTDGNGLASVSLRSTTPGFMTMQAEVNTGAGIVRQTRTLFFASVFPLPTFPPTLSLHVDDGNGTFDQTADYTLFKTAGDNQRVLRADVLDGAGNRIVNATVTFGSDRPFRTSPTGTCSDGSSTCGVTFVNGNTATTNAQGQASVLVQFNATAITNIQTVVNMTAQTTVNNESAFNLVSLFLSPTTVSQMTVTATPSIVGTGGTSSVSAVLILSSGDPAPDGTSVGFTSYKAGDPTTPCGSITPFAQTVGGVTNPAATFTAPSLPGTCTVKAKVGTVERTTDILVNSTLSVQPSTQTISGATGGTATFTIFGGVPGYTVTSNNPSLGFNGTPGTGTWSVAASGDTFVVTVPAGSPGGSVTLTVRDAVGATVTATLTVTGGPALSVQPGSQSISGVTGGTATFTIFGGIPGYTVTSANPAIAFNGTPGTGTWSVAASGGTFVVTVPAGAPATTVALTVRDNNGTTVAATLAISGPDPLLITPKTVSVVSSGVSQTLSFTITGGNPGSTGYVTTSTDPSKAFNTTAGNGVWTGSPITVTFPANVSAGSVTLNVFDSVGTTTTATITIIGPSPASLLISPNVVSIVSSGAAQTVTFTISGGTPGSSGYVTTSTDPSKAFDTAAGDGIWSGTPITVNFPANVAAGTVTLNVLDSVGGTTSAAITILGPGGGSALMISPNVVSVVSQGSSQTLTFAISGGTPGASGYVTTSTDPSRAYNGSAGVGVWTGPSVTVTFPANVGTGAITLNVLDSVGGTTSAAITVIGGGPLNVSPGSVSVTGISGSSADSVTFIITGGSGTYGSTVLSNNTAVVPNATVVGNTFTANPETVAASTAVTMTVIDSLGATKTVTVTVTPPTSSLGINPSSISVSGVTPILFHILGGLAPFRVYSSDTGVIGVGGNPLVTSSDTFTGTTAGVAGGATVTVVDADGKTVISTVTVNLPTPDFTITCAPVAVNNVTTSTCTLTSLNGYATPVTLSCSPAAPTPGGSCGFAPNPVTPTGGGATSTLTYACVGAGGPAAFDVIATDGSLTHTFAMTATCP
jgi:hypothetical protein